MMEVADLPLFVTSDVTKLRVLLDIPGSKLLYEYDFGDGWQHEVLLEEILAGDECFQRTCVAGARNCPPEDCGGQYGFAELLGAFQDRSHPEHSSAREWLGERFDPEQFSAAEINRKLRRRRGSANHA
jgi:hypothetical protein